MKIVNTILLLVMFSMTMFAQEDSRPTINGQFGDQLVECSNQLYSTTLKLNISDYTDPVVLDRVKTRFSFNTAGLSFDNAVMINFTEANGYESTVYLSSDDGRIWVEFELLEGGAGFEMQPDTFYNCVQLNFIILDCEEFANVCPFEPQIFQAEDVNGNLTIGEWLCDETALPVELTSFTAHNINNTVVLNWETATELNNYGFNVQRNGETIGFVPGYGNSNSPKSYSFTNVPTTSGTYSYRLQQIDNDGTTELSSEVFVDIVLNRFELSQNYPNPFNPSTTIGFFLNRSEDVSLVVYDIIGSQVAVLAQGSYDEGYNEVSFNASNLSSGMYIYRLQTDSGVLTKTMILLK